MKMDRYIPLKNEIFHVHTHRCKHAGDEPDEAYINKAIEIGVPRVFTDHAPFPGNPFGNRMDYEEFPEYIHTLSELKSRYEDRIGVVIGLEIEYFPCFKHYYEELKATPGLELIMLGQHMYETTPRHYSFELSDKSREYIGLGKAIIDGLGTGLFKAVAHPDRIFRHCGLWNNEMSELADMIIEVCIRKQICMEQNEESKRHKGFYREEFWNRVSPYNDSLIIKGLDAHSTSEIHI